MDKFYDTEHEESNKKSRVDFLKHRDREISDLKKVLKLPEGRRFIYKILSECGAFKASFSLNSMQTAFNEGKRDIGLMMLRMLDEAEPQAYSQMLKEHFSELKSRIQDKKTEE
jgi:hypothetical protein